MTDTREQRARAAAQELAERGATAEQVEQAVARIMAEQPRPESGTDRVRGLAQLTGQGATLGFADEILGGIAGAQRALPRILGGEGGSFREGRDEYTQRFRGQEQAFRKAHPVASTVAEVGGAVIPAVATLGALPAAASLTRRAAPTAIQRGARMAKIGAGYGGVAGAGHSEGGLANRAAGAAVGATVGGVAAPVIGATAPRAGRAVVRGVERGAQAVQRGINRLPSRIPLARSAADATATPASRRSAERAADLWVDAFERDRVPLETVRARGGRQSETPMMLMDMGGRNVASRAEAAATIPSKAQEEIPAALMARQEGQSSRLLRGAQRDVGRGREFYSTADEAQQALRTNAKPLYDRAYESAPEVNDPRISELLELPAFQRAYKRAVELAKHEGVELPTELALPANFGGPPELAQELARQAGQRGPSLRVLDYVKRGLDDIIAGEEMPALTFGAKPRTTELGRSLNNLKREFVEILDDLAPDYRAARAQYRGDREVITALEEGRGIFKEPHKQLARRWQDMSEAEREMYRVGASEAFVEEAGRVRSTGTDLTKRIWGPQNSNVRQNVQLMFRGDPRGYRRFRTLLDQEATANRTMQLVTGNSATARRVAGQLDMAGVNVGEVASGVGNMASGNVGGLGRQAMTALIRRGVQGMNENVADEMGRMATARAGSKKFADVLREMDQAQRRRQSARLNRYRSTAVSGTVAGGSTTRP